MSADDWITVERGLFEAVVESLEAIHDANAYEHPCRCGLDGTIAEARRVLDENES